MINSFTNLTTWKKAEEIFGITSQLRRAAVSISSNIAEGFSRISKKEKFNSYIWH